MSRKSLTGSSDPSFLAFACRVREFLELIEAEPWASAAAAAHAAIRRQADRELFGESERHLLRKSGVPTALLDNPAMAPHFERYADLCLADLAAFKSKHRAAPPSSQQTDTEWRPRRWTVVSVVVGTHCAFGGGKRGKTAHLLCRGITHRRANWRGLRHDAVRNAIDSFARRMIRRIDLVPSICIGLAHQARVMDDLWKRAHAELPGKAFQHLADTGDLVRWYDEIDARAEPLPDLDPSIHDVLGRMLSHVKRLQASLAA